MRRSFDNAWRAEALLATTARSGYRTRMAKTSGGKPMTSDGVWEIRKGEPRRKARPRDPLGDVEQLDYNNPYGYEIERVWFDGKVIYASEQGEVDIDETKVKVAQEYQIVYSVQLNAQRRLKGG